jgi:hypothetical protein
MLFVMHALTTSSKVAVQPEGIEFVRQKYCPPNDPVFDLVPPDFGELASRFYVNMGSPLITRDNVWNVYLELLRQFRDLDDVPFPVEWRDAASLGRQQEAPPAEDFDTDLFPNLQLLAGGVDAPRDDGSIYYGGVNGGLGPGL